jgi:hypothetical protein
MITLYTIQALSLNIERASSLLTSSSVAGVCDLLLNMYYLLPLCAI